MQLVDKDLTHIEHKHTELETHRIAHSMHSIVVVRLYLTLNNIKLSLLSSVNRLHNFPYTAVGVHYALMFMAAFYAKIWFAISGVVVTFQAII